MSITLPSFFETLVQHRIQPTTWFQYPHQPQGQSLVYPPNQTQIYSQAQSYPQTQSQPQIHDYPQSQSHDYPSFEYLIPVTTGYPIHGQSSEIYSCYPTYIQYRQEPIYYPENYLHQNLYHPYPIPGSRMKRLRTVENLQDISSTNKNEFARLEISEVPEKKMKKASFIVKPKELKAYFGLLADELIQDFLEADSCVKISDKYLLAMVFAYFKRACFTIREYTRTNFFVALYLANDVEEDDEDLKYEIFPWALGRKWKDKYAQFLLKRDKLFKRIGYRAIVSRRCCDEIMALMPTNLYWSRERPVHHAGAIRNYMRDPDDDGYPRGPDASPRICQECDISDSQYDSASADESSAWYISSRESSPSHRRSGKSPLHDVTNIFFNMQGLKKNLPTNCKLNNDEIWPTSNKEE